VLISENFQHTVDQEGISSKRKVGSMRFNRSDRQYCCLQLVTNLLRNEIVNGNKEGFDLSVEIQSSADSLRAKSDRLNYVLPQIF